MERVIGIGVSAGTSCGPAALLLQHPLALRYTVSADRIAGETARLEAARESSRRQLRAIRSRVTRSGGAELGQLFEVQLLMLDDPLLVPRAAGIIAEDRVNAEWAVERAFDELAAVLNDVEDPYLRERHGDVADVVGRLSMNLRSGRPIARDLLKDLDQPSVLVADDLSPSVAGQLDRRRVLALVVGAGSRTYHTSIIARSLKIPAVVGLGPATARIRPGATLIVDGTSGEVVIDPTDAQVSESQGRDARRSSKARHNGVEASAAPIMTLDGVRVELEANIELADDLAFAQQQGACGIGLFRSEFLLAGQPTGSYSEDAQYAAYRDLLERMAPKPVSIRTFDLDETQAAGLNGDARSGTELEGGLSSGPLGLRGIRLSLSQSETFRTQLRALGRAARHGRLRILFPFVASIDELREARAVLQSVLAGMREPGAALPDVSVGVMIEVPSAALTADVLAEEADFFSIGTNDLIQYSLAVDRTDTRVARSYEPLHPAILRMIRHVVRAAGRHGRPMSVCGEMASDPMSLLLLIGIGVRDFSMYPAAIPAARRLVESVRVSELRRAAVTALRMRTGREIEEFAAATFGAVLRSAGVGATGERQGEHRER